MFAGGHCPLCVDVEETETPAEEDRRAMLHRCWCGCCCCGCWWCGCCWWWFCSPRKSHLFSAASLRLLDAENCWEDLWTLCFCKQPRFSAGILGKVRVDDISDSNRLVIVKDCRNLLLWWLDECLGVQWGHNQCYCVRGCRSDDVTCFSAGFVKMGCDLLWRLTVEVTNCYLMQWRWIFERDWSSLRTQTWSLSTAASCP